MPRCRRCRVKDFGLGFGWVAPFLCPQCVAEKRDTVVELSTTAEDDPASRR